jgi:hypothetical protein
MRYERGSLNGIIKIKGSASYGSPPGRGQGWVYGIY